MKKNMGSADKIIRIVAVLAVVGLYFAGMISGVLAIILFAVASVLALTSYIGVCPLYLPFGLSTLRSKSQTKNNE